jgi:hypothetical protein
MFDVNAKKNTALVTPPRPVVRQVSRYPQAILANYSGLG